MPVPSAPTGLSGITTIGQNALTWNLVGGAINYNIYVGGVLHHSGVSRPYGDVCNTALIFSYTVTAVNGSGESAQSAPWVSTIAQPQTPGNFTGVTSFQDNYTTWDAVTADHYNIYANGGIIANDITDLFYDFSGVNTAYAYTYTLTAVINNVESIPAVWVSSILWAHIASVVAGLPSHPDGEMYEESVIQNDFLVQYIFNTSVPGWTIKPLMGDILAIFEWGLDDTYGFSGLAIDFPPSPAPTALINGQGIISGGEQIYPFFKLETTLDDSNVFSVEYVADNPTPPPDFLPGVPLSSFGLLEPGVSPGGPVVYYVTSPVVGPSPGVTKIATGVLQDGAVLRGEVNGVPASLPITGLIPGMTYHFRMNGVGPVGESFGDDFTFTTSPPMPDTPVVQAGDDGTGATPAFGVHGAGRDGLVLNLKGRRI